MHTSKYGSSALTKSPIMTSSLRCSGLPCTRLVTSAAMRGSISTATTLRHASRMRTVRLPVPGPTSSTISVGLREALGRKDGVLVGWIVQLARATCLVDNSVISARQHRSTSSCHPPHSPLRDQRIHQDVLAKLGRVKQVVPASACSACCSVRSGSALARPMRGAGRADRRRCVTA